MPRWSFLIGNEQHPSRRLHRLSCRKRLFQHHPVICLSHFFWFSIASLARPPPPSVLLVTTVQLRPLRSTHSLALEEPTARQLDLSPQPTALNVLEDRTAWAARLPSTAHACLALSVLPEATPIRLFRVRRERSRRRLRSARHHNAPRVLLARSVLWGHRHPLCAQSTRTRLLVLRCVSCVQLDRNAPQLEPSLLQLARLVDSRSLALLVNLRLLASMLPTQER